MGAKWAEPLLEQQPLTGRYQAVLTPTLAAAILQGAIGARWVGWLSALSSAACLVSAVIGSLDTASMVPPLGLLGFFITVTALSVSMLRDRSPAPAAGLTSRQATAACTTRACSGAVLAGAHRSP